MSTLPTPSHRWLTALICVLAITAAVQAIAADQPAAAPTPAQGGCMASARLVGVNLAGAEFNSRRLPGLMNRDYVYPNKNDLAYFAGKGVNTIRLPFRWERVQPELMGELDPLETAAIQKVIDAAEGLNLCVILDVHNFGTYRGRPLGSSDVPEAAFIDLWTRLAGRFPDENRVALDLMNEPKALIIADWATYAQHTVNALRAAGAPHLILVSGGRWAGVHEWSKSFSGTSNAKAFAEFRDPANRMLIEMHQYADPNYSGTGLICIPPEAFDNMFRIAGEWAQQTRHQLFLGEFGTPPDPPCLAALERILSLTKDASVWRGWTYWAGGSWWGPYPLSVQPFLGGVDKPQMTILEDYFGQ